MKSENAKGKPRWLMRVLPIWMQVTCQSGLTPSAEHGLNEQMVEKLTLDPSFGLIFGGNSVPESLTTFELDLVVQSCLRTRRIASNEQIMPHPERKTWPSTPANIPCTDTLEQHSVVQGRPKNSKNYINRANNATPRKNDMAINSSQHPLCKYSRTTFCSSSRPENSRNYINREVTIGSNLTPRIMTNTKSSTMLSPSTNLTDAKGLDPVVQTISRKVEVARNEIRRKRKWFEDSGDGRIDVSGINKSFENLVTIFGLEWSF